MPATIAGAAAVMDHPPGSYAIVLTGAEPSRRIRSGSVMRAAGGALLGQEGAAHRVGRGLLLWTEDAVPEFLARRIDENTTSLAQWLMGSPARFAQLVTQRTAHALAMANEAEEGPARPPRHGQQSRRVRKAASCPLCAPPWPSSRSRARSSGGGSGQPHARAHSITGHHAARPGQRYPLGAPRPGPTRGGVNGHPAHDPVERRYGSADPGPAGQSRRHASELLDVIDWTLVNDVALPPDGQALPDPIVQSFIREQPGIPHTGGRSPLLQSAAG